MHNVVSFAPETLILTEEFRALWNHEIGYRVADACAKYYTLYYEVFDHESLDTHLRLLRNYMDVDI